MPSGLSKHWTPEVKQLWERRLRKARTFAERYMVITMLNLFKYDWRSKQAKKAKALARLQLIIATDADLEELANLEAHYYQELDPDSGYNKSAAYRFEELKKRRALFSEQGIKRSDLECR